MKQLLVDDYLDRIPTKDYNCLDFVTEVWTGWFGEIASWELQKLCEAAHRGEIDAVSLRSFKRLKSPSSPCLVVYQRPRQSPHIGIYLDGNVLHLQETGVHFLPVDVVTRCFNVRARYYKYEHNLL